MPTPSRMTINAQLRVVRRWTITVAVLYAVAAVGLALIAALHQASMPASVRVEAPISRIN
jgi:hypothetical protein